MNKLALIVTLSISLITACTTANVHPLFTSSEVISVKEYTSFEQYLENTKRLVTRNRHFLSNFPENEARANLPFELKPKQNSSPSKGVLLVHGLGDSPFSFVDIADDLASRGYLVRTILLPGHGTKPGDMLEVQHEEWEQMVAKQTELLKRDVDEVYLGGFSTGGNLAYLQAVKDKTIKGLMLFSPGFKSNEPLAPYVYLLKPFKKWLLTGTPYEETNYVRYRAMPTNGFVQYQATTKKVRQNLESNSFNRPVFVVLSEHDSVLDVNYIREIFHKQFTHPQSRLMWFGSQPTKQIGRVDYIHSYMPEFRIRNMSHMGMLFSPENPYYGINGSEKICNNHNGDDAEQDEQLCKKAEIVWYSAFDGQEGEIIHARLTFNPIFKRMMENLFSVFSH